MVARSLNLVIEFAHAGQLDVLRFAQGWLRQAAELATSECQPGWWWIVRLLALIVSDLEESSPWTFLVPLFPPETQEQLERYIRFLAFARIPGIELWISQRAALPIVLAHDHPGAVINLRTSGGKTRVAEIAILDTLTRDPSAKVLYLAPFRSLAVEVEHTLSGSFSVLGFQASHIYGGSRVSAVDTNLVDEASIVIATPEKARALFRATPEALANVKLFIIDEGHLLGADERHVRNEIFFDHVRAIAKSSSARASWVASRESVSSWVAWRAVRSAAASKRSCRFSAVGHWRARSWIRCDCSSACASPQAPLRS